MSAAEETLFDESDVVHWNTTETMAALSDRYKAPEYAFLPQVANGTGGQRSRTCDALAMSVWPSRGLDLIGFEVKVSRGDWLSEKKNPQKADAIAKYCDFWYLVAGAKDIVRDGELPTGWGLLIPRGHKLIVKKEAPRLEPEPITRAFLAALLRKAADTMIDRSQIETEVRRARETAYKDGVKYGEQNAERKQWSMNTEYDRLKFAVAAFEEKSGVKIDDWRGDKIGEAVRYVIEGGLETSRKDIERIRAIAEMVIEVIDGKPRKWL
jgi:hypothetical protein